MTPLGNLLMALANILDIAINLMFFLLLARVVLSWVQPAQPHPAIQTLFAVTEPFLHPIRTFLQRFTGATAIDFSPIVAFFALIFLQQFLVVTLAQIAQSINF